MLSNANTTLPNLASIDIYKNLDSLLRDICDSLSVKYKKKIKNINQKQKDEKASIHKKISCLFLLVIENQEGNMKFIVEEMRAVYFHAHEKQSLPMFEDVQERLKLYHSALDFMSVVTKKIVSDIQSGNLKKNVAIKAKPQRPSEENSKEEEIISTDQINKSGHKNLYSIEKDENLKNSSHKNLIKLNPIKGETKRQKKYYEENFNPSFLDVYDQLLMKTNNIDEHEVNPESISTMKNLMSNLINIVKIQNEKIEKKDNECRQLKLQYLLLKDETDKKFEQYEERLDNINTVLMNLVFNK
jgi:hypothetical protein